MRVLVTIEDHLWRGPDGCAYANGPVGYASWSELLDVFDTVLLVARTRAENVHPQTGIRIDGPLVSVHGLPNYTGAWEYVLKLPALRKRIREAVGTCDAYVLHVPGLVAYTVWREIERGGKPYAVDVMGDPWDTLGPRSLRTPLRPILRRGAVRDLRSICQQAIAVHYVTQDFLQKRYPASKRAYTAGFSDALTDAPLASVFDLDRRLERMGSFGRPIYLGFVGSLAQLYKGLDVLLRAVSLCRERGVDMELAIAGDGRYLEEMKSLCGQLRIQDRTKFLGQLSYGKPVFDFLDSVDLFVLPSYAEGLPRALLEAMSRGCPCIATNVGGIPELLAAEDMVPPGDPIALANKITAVVRDPARMRQMAERNLAKTREYSPEILANARREFYRFVRSHSIRT